jgi:branched-chain amino acid transport system permease protein
MMRNRAVEIAVGCLFVGLLVWPALTNAYLTSVGFTLMMWIALTQSWTILSGMTGYLSLGHVAFYGLGAYIVALGWGSLPIWLSLAAGGAASALVALIVGFPSLRVRGPYFVMLTLGLSELAKYSAVNIESSAGQTGRLLFGAPSLITLYYAMLALALIAFVLAYCVRRSKYGLGLLSIREDEEGAQTLGVPTVRYKLAAFAVSAVIPGIVGGLVVMRTGYFEPLPQFDPLISLTIVAMAMIGGNDDAPGPLLGAIFFAILSELLWAQFPQLYMILVGAILVVMVTVAPDGLAGRMRAWSQRRRAPEGG